MVPSDAPILAEVPGKVDWADVAVAACIDSLPSQVRDVDVVILQTAVAHLDFDERCKVLGVAPQTSVPRFESTTGLGGVSLPTRSSPVANAHAVEVTEPYGQLAMAKEASGTDVDLSSSAAVDFVLFPNRDVGPSAANVGAHRIKDAATRIGNDFAAARDTAKLSELPFDAATAAIGYIEKG